MIAYLIWTFGCRSLKQANKRASHPPRRNKPAGQERQERPHPMTMNAPQPNLNLHAEAVHSEGIYT